MANNDILVQSSLQSVHNKLETTQQGAMPTAAVFSQARMEDVTANSSQAKLQTQQQDQRHTLYGAVDKLNDQMQHFNRNIQFSIDDESGDTVIKVLDADTGKLIRQLPSQDVLDLHNTMEKYQGVLLETQV